MAFSQYKAGLMLGVKRSQTSEIVKEVAMALVNRSRDYIKWPKASEMRRLADSNNEEFGLPDCPLGVDGKFAPGLGVYLLLAAQTKRRSNIYPGNIGQCSLSFV